MPGGEDKIPLVFFRNSAGSEPVRKWLKELSEIERRAIGRDLTDLPTKRTARVLVCLHRGHLVALHGFIKKTRATPDEDWDLANKRKRELEQ
jgi:phage-related protein